MQEVTKYPVGTFSWVDLATTDAPGAKKFYTELMGWTANDIPIGPDSFYTMLQLEGRDVAALSQMSEEQQSQGMPPMWNSYVSVENADESAEKAAALGGTVMAPPFDVFDSGRMAVIQDPTGAVFSVWQPKSHIGAKLVNIPGTLGWNELVTKDVAQAKSFYSQLFGWESETQDMGNGMEYTTIMNKGRGNGGMIQMTEEWGDAPSHWMVYFSVANCDASIEKAKTLGASVHVPPQDIPEVGRFSMIQDPQGASLTLIQLVNPEAPPSA
jgi:predicted enzyme related to lactoylglutathione lyase